MHDFLLAESCAEEKLEKETLLRIGGVKQCLELVSVVGAGGLLVVFGLVGMRQQPRDLICPQQGI